MRSQVQAPQEPEHRASGLLSFASVCVLLLAASLASACAIGADGSEIPETLSLTA